MRTVMVFGVLVVMGLVSLSFSGSEAVTFTNPTPILIPAGQPAVTSGAAAPYPSPIVVIGLTGLVTSVTVTLSDMNHTFPGDIDILLVGPTGADALIMSDVGGSNDLVNVTLTLDDAASSNLPATGQIVSGTFRPTNVGLGDPFPAPAPTPSGNSLLSIFNGTDPNGTWNLFVVDDAAADVGNINGGWTLNVTTSSAVPEPTTLLLLGSGLLGLVGRTLSRRHKL